MPKQKQPRIMTKPKIQIETTIADWLFETVGLIGITFTVVLVISSYSDLPDTIPRHYNASGQPDGFSGKSILFVLPAVTIVTYIIMTIALRFPHMFNYPFEITEENAERQYKNQILMVRVLKTFTVIIFGYLTYATIQNGLGKMQGLGTWFTPVTLLSILGTIGYFMYKGFRFR
jgi:uncharacterized membrane protein